VRQVAGALLLRRIRDILTFIPEHSVRRMIAVPLWLGLVMGLAGCADIPAGAARPVRSLIEQREHNVVLQNWELSCAAAALATVLRYQYALPVTERTVALGLIDRAEYLANPNLVRLRRGFSLLDMKRYVDGLGLEGVGLGQLAFSDLIDLAPIIVPMKLQGFPHFVVFRGATSRTVLLADPAFGNITMSRTKFMHGWIDFRGIHHVGFVVKESGALAPPGRLAAHLSDFAVLR
jgi:predicted double-glycine peptidase